MCSNDDAEQFVQLYGINRDKVVLVPNGVDVEQIQPASVPSPVEKKPVREQMRRKR